MRAVPGTGPLLCCLIGGMGGTGLFAFGIAEGGLAGNMGMPTISGLLAIVLGPILAILMVIGIYRAAAGLRKTWGVRGVTGRRRAWAAILIGILSLAVLVPAFWRLKKISARRDGGDRTQWQLFWDPSYPP